MDKPVDRELYEGYLAMRHNACWQWLAGELAQKREYFIQALLQAGSWEACCRAQGALQLAQSLLGQIAMIQEGGEGK